MKLLFSAELWRCGSKWWFCFSIIGSRGNDFRRIELFFNEYFFIIFLYFYIFLTKKLKFGEKTRKYISKSLLFRSIIYYWSHWTQTWAYSFYFKVDSYNAKNNAPKNPKNVIGVCLPWNPNITQNYRCST